jgi:hypothetical protein
MQSFSKDTVASGWQLITRRTLVIVNEGGVIMQNLSSDSE